MEILAVLRLLWRHRFLVAVGALLAAVLGYMVMRGPATYFSVASTRVMLDTSESELVAPDPTGADTLAWRASLVADLVSDGTGRARIARTMGIRPADLAVVAPYRAVPQVATPLPVDALDAASKTTQPYVVAVQGVATLPIIAVDASAPTTAGAAKLARAATGALQAAATPPAGHTGVIDYSVEPMGGVTAHKVVNRPRKLVGLAATVVVFTVWCFALLVLDAAWRAIRIARVQTRTAAAAGPR